MIGNDEFKGMVFRQENGQHAEQIQNLQKVIALCDEKLIGYELLAMEICEKLRYNFDVGSDRQIRIEQKNENDCVLFFGNRKLKIYSKAVC